MQGFENYQLYLPYFGAICLFFSLYFLTRFRRSRQKSPTTKKPSEKKEDQYPSKQRNLLKQLNVSLSKTRVLIGGQLEKIFPQKGQLTPDQVESLHEILYRSDMGIETVEKLIDTIKTEFKQNTNTSLDAIKVHLRQKISDITNQAQDSEPKPSNPARPHIILIVGVNGVGKTTTIGKLAAH